MTAAELRTHRGLDAARPYTVSAFRAVIGLLFTCHGIATLFGALGGDALDPGTWPGWYAAVIQLAGGALVALGLTTRAAALIGSGSMAFAYFDVHQQRALLPIQNGGEAAAVFCWALLLLVFTGPGPLSLDHLLHARTARSAAEAVPAERTTGSDRMGKGAVTAQTP